MADKLHKQNVMDRLWAGDGATASPQAAARFRFAQFMAHSVRGIAHEVARGRWPLVGTGLELQGFRRARGPLPVSPLCKGRLAPAWVGARVCRCW
jgi:hypothetical protein